MYVRLTAKLADVMEGVDLSAYAEGDVVDLPDREAELLISGSWAERVPREQRVRSVAPPPAVAAERSS